MKEQYPVKAVGMGGRQVLTGNEYGNIYDHFSVVYEYADGARLISNCRQQPGCVNDMSAHVLGTKGRAVFQERKNGLRIESNAGSWHYAGPQNDIYQTEHDEFFASIRGGRPINNGEYMARSTLLAIMGRMAAYTGQEITWEMALNSRENLEPGPLRLEGHTAGRPDRHSRPDTVRLTGGSMRKPRKTRAGAAMPPGPWSELVALNRRTWLGITGAGIAGGLARARARLDPARALPRPATSPRPGAARQPGSRSPA